MKSALIRLLCIFLVSIGNVRRRALNKWTKRLDAVEVALLINFFRSNLLQPLYNGWKHSQDAAVVMMVVFVFHPNTFHIVILEWAWSYSLVCLLQCNSYDRWNPIPEPNSILQYSRFVLWIPPCTIYSQWALRMRFIKFVAFIYCCWHIRRMFKTNLISFE